MSIIWKYIFDHINYILDSSITDEVSLTGMTIWCIEVRSCHLHLWKSLTHSMGIFKFWYVCILVTYFITGMNFWINRIHSVHGKPTATDKQRQKMVKELCNRYKTDKRGKQLLTIFVTDTTRKTNQYFTNYSLLL